jgi:hypothetical protein
MARFEVVQRERRSTPTGNYEYELLRDGSLVALYWHDFRGDEQGFVVDGLHRSSPFGRAGDVIAGGAGSPLSLTPEAVEFVESLLKATIR